MQKEPNYNPPDDALEALARCLYPLMVAYFESAVGKREFADWQARQVIGSPPNEEAKPDKNVRQVA